jgi:hypothetical protein
MRTRDHGSIAFDDTVNEVSDTSIQGIRVLPIWAHALHLRRQMLRLGAICRIVSGVLWPETTQQCRKDDELWQRIWEKRLITCLFDFLSHSEPPRRRRVTVSPVEVGRTQHFGSDQ